MAVECAKCGEELLGAVNCCWRCGHAFEAHSGPSDVPPVRRPPPPMPYATVLSADNEQEGGSQERSQQAPTIIRRGSPFADRGTAEASVLTDDPPATDSSALQRAPARGQGGSAVAAAITFPIGGIALILAFTFPAGGVVVSAFGIAIGTWGLYSRRRGVALTGLLICCICLAIAGFNTAVELHIYFRGYAPWESNDPAFP